LSSSAGRLTPTATVGMTTSEFGLLESGFVERLSV